MERITIHQLEKMKTHELADLFENVVLLLRRLPDVEFRELTQQAPTSDLVQQLQRSQQLPSEPAFTSEELGNKKLDELKRIAKSLGLSQSGNKADLVKKTLIKTARGHSEQYAIQNV